MSGATARRVRVFRLVLLGLACAGSLALVVAARLGSEKRRVQEAVPRVVKGVATRDLSGSLVALGSPERVVLVVSYTCPHCHTTLQRIARESRGDTLPGLQVVAMEGPEKAARLLAELGVHAQALGPAETTQFAAALRVRAVPLVLETDAQGAVVRARVGALDEAEAAALVEVTRRRE